jgi:glycosyltransferase involved in cell wall biosynthesis
MSKVLVTHPGLQHSHQLAQALYEADMLSCFISGVPVRENNNEWKFFPSVMTSKIKIVAIPKAFRRHPIYWQLIFRLAGRFGSAGFKHDFAHKIFHYFDDCMAKEVLLLKPDAVVCFENSAASTFAAAKKIGAKCILDAPSIHYKAAAGLVGSVSNGYLLEVNARKEKELELADLVIACSDYGAGTYIESGVPKNKVQSLLLGAELPSSLMNVDIHKTNKKIRFIFAGAMRKLKSIDLILSVFKKLEQESVAAELIIVGGSDSEHWIEMIECLTNVTYAGSLPQQDLYRHFLQADCLLLPSRFDAFGMVVAEAMAAGVPAIVSTATGAKEMIEQFPGSGWVINADEKSIYDAVKNTVEGRWSLADASVQALKASEYFTWSAYRKRVASLIQAVLHG